MVPALSALALAFCAAGIPEAAAQSHGYYSRDPNVTIDLSVLDGTGRPGGESGYYGSDGLQFPPAAPPRSRLLGPLAGQSLQLTPPSTSTSDAAPRSSSPRPSAPAASAPPPAAPPPPQTAARAVEPPVAPAQPQPDPATPPAPAVTQPAAPAAEPPASRPPQSAAVPPAPDAAPPPAPPPATQTAGRDDGETASTETGAPAAQPAESQPAESQPSETQTAARSPGASPGAAPAAEGMTRILFETGSAKVPASSQAALDSLARELNANDTLRVQLLAYADGESDAANPARRLSLSRALAVRSALIEKGIRSTRMDVRALGNKYGDDPADRVDAVVVER